MQKPLSLPQARPAATGCTHACDHPARLHAFLVLAKALITLGLLNVEEREEVLAAFNSVLVISGCRLRRIFLKGCPDYSQPTPQCDATDASGGSKGGCVQAATQPCPSQQPAPAAPFQLAILASVRQQTTGME